MKRENLNKEIIRLAAPAILNNITVPLLGLCDTAIAGHLGSPSYLGAVSIGAMMLNVFFWLAGFLRMGTTGLTARGYGRSSVVECREVLRKSLILAGGISLIILLFQIPFLKLLIRLVAPDSEIAELASLYFRIGVWGVPAQLAVMAVSGWFIGMQTTVVPMTIAIGTNIINILASIGFAFGLGWGFRGIICGTLCANWIGAIAALVWAWIIYCNTGLESKEKNFQLSELDKDSSEIIKENESRKRGESVRWRELFSVNGALFIRSACIMAVSLTVTSVGARLGELTLAANAIIMQFFLFFSYFMDGFAFSGEALAGKYFGAGRFKLIRATMSSLCGWGMVMASLFFLIYFFGSPTITALLTDSTQVIAETEKYRLWILLLPPITVAAFIFDGLFVGLTRTRAMMNVTIAGAAVFFILLFLCRIPLGNNLLWLSFECYLFIRGIALAIIFLRLSRNNFE